MKAMHGLCVLALLTGCYASKHDTETLQRLTRIEQRLDAQDKALAEALAHSNTVELSAVAEQLQDMHTKLDTLLAQVKTAKPARAPRPEPDAKTTYSVPIGPSAAFGPRDAKVTLVMALDFDCPYCRRAFATVDELRKKYGKDLRVVYKPFIVHPKTALLAAQATCAANKQGKWRELADLIWTQAYDVKGKVPDAYSPDHIAELAKQATLDMKRYQQDVAGVCVQEVRNEWGGLGKLGVNGTPTFFINGRYLSGALSIETLSVLIDEEAAKATEAIARGVKADQYYEQEIVAKGQTGISQP